MSASPSPPFFSVCVPVFNGALYLRDCLDSILAQTFTDLEIIVVDDCSTDGSLALLEQYRGRDSRLHVHANTQNLGLVANWNKCVSLACGRWVKFLFQDDFWQPHCLERVHAACEGQHLLFHARAFEIASTVRPALRAFYESELVQRIPELQGVTQVSPELACALATQRPGFNFFGEPSSVAFEREQCERLGPFDERLVQLCDYEFWLRIATVHGARYLPEPLSTFRVHGGAASTANIETRQFRYRYLDKLILVERFSRDPAYANLRQVLAASQPGRLEEMLRAQHVYIAEGFRELSTADRREVTEQLRLYLPDSASDILGLAQQNFGLLRGSLRRVLRAALRGTVGKAANTFK